MEQNSAAVHPGRVNVVDKQCGGNSVGLTKVSILKKVWGELSRAFGQDYTAEGFKRTGIPFGVPENVQELEPLLKRKVTICNLFANEHQSIGRIAHILDLEEDQVISALLETRLISERRFMTKPVSIERRANADWYHISLALITGRKVHELRTLCGAKSDNYVFSEFALQDLVKASELCKWCQVEYLRRHDPSQELAR